MNTTRLMRRNRARRAMNKLTGVSLNQRRRQDGGLSAAAIALTVGLMAVVLIGSWVLAMVNAQQQARAGADLVAITTAEQALTVQDDQIVCQQAEVAAQAASVTLEDCQVIRAGSELAVSVEVQAPIAWVPPGWSDSAKEQAIAGNLSLGAESADSEPA
jgi:hypothetical protein